MKFYRQVQLKSGVACILRNPVAGDAGAVLQHMILTSGETGNMVRYPDEITMTALQEQEYLREVEESPNAVQICAELDGKIVANASLTPISALDKYKHRAEFGISIQRAFWGMGIGSAVLSAIVGMAEKAGYEQIELEVAATNRRAVALYEKYGFRRYGTRENSFHCRDGSRVSEDLMMLLLPGAL